MTSTGGADLVCFDVEATDGSIGKVDEAAYDVGASYVVVDTGPVGDPAAHADRS